MTQKTAGRPKYDELDGALAESRSFVGYAFFFSIFVNLLMLTGPLFMLQVYDRVLGSRSEETLVALVILVVALYGFMWLLDFARMRLVARYGARFQARLDNRVFQATLSAPPGQPAASRANRDLESIQGFLSSPALVSIMDLPFTPIFIGAIFIFHPLLGWLAVAGGLILVSITILNQFLTRKRVAVAQEASESAHRFANNARIGADLIRSQGMVEPVSARWESKSKMALGQNLTAVDWTGAFTSFTKAFRLALQSLVLALGAWLVLQGSMTAGAMIAGSILLGRALAPIEQVLGRWTQIERARQGWHSLKEFLPTVPMPEERTRLPRPEGRVEVSSLTVAGPNGRKPILYNVSFTVEPGEALGVIGRSGSGKTSIAKALLGLSQPSVGEARLGGALMSHYHPSDLGSYVGYLPQEPLLIDGTVAENIARMALEPDSEKIVAAAKKAKAHELILSLPDGYDTRIEGNSIGLSGGQRQRIALARALYGDPVLLVLDEPNSALDAEGTEALNAAVRTLKAETKSVIIMTHRPMAISECDNLLVIESGQVKSQGPRDEVLQSMLRNANEIKQTISVGGQS